VVPLSIGDDAIENLPRIIHIIALEVKCVPAGIQTLADLFFCDEFFFLGELDYSGLRA
jgi:hypothetical protein